MTKQIPDKIRKAVMERDEGQCQYCSRPASQLHHIVYGGTGRKRIHEEYNIISLCWTHHEKVHSDKETREWTYEWSRDLYGDKIDKLLKEKWEG